MFTQPNNQQNIFYIDDDPDDLWLFKEAAKSLGKSVAAFRQSEQLLNAMLNPPPTPSVVFVDLNMGDRSGFEVVEDIRQHQKLLSLPLVIYSTSDNRKTIETCRKLGTALYVIKPAKMKAISKVIQHVTSIDWNNHQITDENFVIKI